MKLNLSVSGKVLASVPINPQQSTDESYLKALRRLLVLRHQKKLTATQQAPLFFVEPSDVKH